jgi:membrane associated rhomboid family serine protease
LTPETQIGAGGPPAAPPKQPAILLPGSVTGLIVLMAAIHLLTTVVLDQWGGAQVLWWFAFIGPRMVAFPNGLGGIWPTLWTPFTHAFLHGDWMHFGINAAWLAIFGTPVARRYGAVKLIVLFLVCAALGAGAFALVTWPLAVPLIGASGGIAGLMGASMRFIFQPVEIGIHPATGERVILGRRMASFPDLARNVRARAFILVWLAINLATPLVPAFTGGTGLNIAWEAHVGGFLAGLLLVPLLERRPHSKQF